LDGARAFADVIANLSLEQGDSSRREHLLDKFANQLSLGDVDADAHAVTAGGLTAIAVCRAAEFSAVYDADRTAAFGASQEAR